MTKFSAIKFLHPGQIQLQGVGWVNAKPASEFKVGESLMWNNAHTSRIKSITPKGKSLVMITISNDTGLEYPRVVRATTMMAIAEMGHVDAHGNTISPFLSRMHGEIRPE